MLKKLSKYMKGLWGLAAISAAGMIVEAICELALPSLANSIYQKVDTAASPESVRTAVILSGLGMLALALLGLFGGVVTMKTSANVSQRFAYRLRGDMYRKISHFSFKNIDQFSTASLTTRMTNDVTTLQNVVMMCLRILVRVPALAVVASCFAVSINPRMSAMLLILLPILIVVVACILKFGFPMFQKMQKKIDNVNRVVKAYVREDREKEKFHDASDDLAAQGAKAAGLIVTVMPVMMLMLNAVVVFVYYKGALEANAGVMEVGQISVFASYVIQILMNLMMISMMLLQLARGKACGDRVVEVLDTEIDITNPQNPYLPENPKGGVEFRDVSFKYNTEGHGDDILEHISFTAKPGQIIGIVGGTGCGKSSLVNLIPRLYDATQGQVLIDGVDVRKYDLTALREMIGVVLQKNVLFSGTIKENIRWGKEDATDEEIVVACQAAQAHDFVLAQPKGYDTDLSQGGLNLSGGQKQRVAAARSLISDPDIILADEPTGALDTKAARLLMEKLQEVNQVQGRTILMVTHDPNAASFCSRILFIQDGVIFHELRRKVPTETWEEFYARILQVMAQMGGGSANVL